MKKMVLFIAILLAIAVCEWQEAASKCCPPPPVTTGPGRTLPRSGRTSPPVSNLTLPPTTNITSTGITPPPGTTTGGPITASGPGTGTRTTAHFSGGFTTNLTNQGGTTEGNRRSNANTPTPSGQRSIPGGSGGASTAPPSLAISNPFGNSAVPVEAEFAWEDWWSQNVGYLLADYSKQEGKSYATLLKRDDVAKLLVLLDYRGIFDEGIHKMAIKGLSELGSAAVDDLIKIADGKYKFPKGAKASFLNKRDYEVLAVRALGELGGKKSKDALAALLMRDMVIIPEQAAADSTGDYLKNVLVKDKKYNEKRFWACFALGKLGDPAYLPVLRQVLETDKDKYVRAAAAEAIAMIGGSKGIQVLRDAIDQSKSYYHVKTFVTASLGYVGSSDPMDDVRAALDSSKGNVRLAGAWALAYLIKRRMDAKKSYSDLLDSFLLALKKEGDDEIRRSMALGWLFFSSPAVLDELKPLLTDSRDGGVRAAAALAAGLSGSPKAVPMLASLPKDDDAAAELARAYAIAFLSSSAKAKLAGDLLASDVPVLKAAGVLLSARLKGAEVYRKIYGLRLYKGGEIVRRAVAYSLVVYLGDKGMGASRKIVAGKHESMKAVALMAYGIRNDADALDQLGKFMRIKDKELKKCVGIGMSLMGGLSLMTSIQDAMKDGKEQVRSAAIVALGSLNRPQLLDQILETIEKDTNFKVRAYAIASLVSMKVKPADEDRVVKLLAKILADRQQRAFVRAMAAFVLSTFPENRLAFEAVRKGLGDTNSDVQAMAAISLGMFGNPSAARDIKTLIANSRRTPLAYAGYIALGMLHDKTFVNDLLSEFEAAGNTDELEALAFAIARCSDSETYAAILPYVENEDIYLREGAVKCLGMMNGLSEEARKEAIKKLTKLEKDDDALIRFLAAVVRYSFGDKNGLPKALEAVTDNSFYLDSKEDMDWTALMRLINSTMPEFYRLPPYFWSEDE